MSDPTDLRNEPTINLSRDDLRDFSGGFRSSQDRGQHNASPKSRWKYLLILLAIFPLIVGGWHWIAANRLEERFNRKIADGALEDSAEFSARVDVYPLTNLVDLQITLKAGRDDASYSLIESLIIEYVRKELEPRFERELSAAARRDNDLYALMFPYQVSISIDEVRMPPVPQPSRMVQEIQHQLKAHGYDPGAADGQMGSLTRKAIEQFQRDHGLKVDGRATGELLEELRKQ